jgi:GR25 family glycosyltransferase involved in LPS biosynthesis
MSPTNTYTSYSPWKNKRVFDAIFCINLNKRTDRWIQVQQEFKKLWIKGKMIRFEAIYTPGDWRIGCAKSHLEILKLARNNNFHSILIFEDDMKCIEENVWFLEQDLTNLLKTDWNIFYLWCQFLKKWDLPFLISSKNLLKMGWGRWTHAIAYHKSCYASLIRDFRMIENNCEKFIRIFGAIDVYLEKILHPKLKVYMVNQVVCEQSSDYSDINKKVMIWRIKKKYFTL